MPHVCPEHVPGSPNYTPHPLYTRRCTNRAGELLLALCSLSPRSQVPLCIGFSSVFALSNTSHSLNASICPWAVTAELGGFLGACLAAPQPRQPCLLLLSPPTAASWAAGKASRHFLCSCTSFPLLFPPPSLGNRASCPLLEPGGHGDPPAGVPEGGEDRGGHLWRGVQGSQQAHGAAGGPQEDPLGLVSGAEPCPQHHHGSEQEGPEHSPVSKVVLEAQKEPDMREKFSPGSHEHSEGPALAP